MKGGRTLSGRSHKITTLKLKLFYRAPYSLCNSTWHLTKLNNSFQAFWTNFYISVLGIERQRKLKKFAILTRKPRAILEYRYIERDPLTV